ncbi:MAG TPA: toll/interleukin-1 receptor domain-containing protein [Candidatus Binatia bacterium]|nr:toll/interleukin-1 receptor domain-containing protein [Candidatus Binatia bacterium]
MSGIFISYRREDSAAYAGRLYDRLSARFGAAQVFMDVDDIPPGADFAAHIGAKVGSCDAAIVVIGRNWAGARDSAGRLRLSDPHDFVGLEVAHALRRKILVIPVLVGGAAMPKPEELRSDLKGLAGRNALTLNDQDFQRDTDSLIQALEKIPGLGKAATQIDDPKAELRKKLLRRLAWKLPIIFLLVSFAVWWQWRKEQAAPTETESRTKAAAAFAGAWAGDVTYSWGASYREQFFFQPEGGRLFGTASFLGAKRGIEDGKVDGENISFVARFQETSDGTTRDHKNYYWGERKGSEILLRMQDDRGNPPLEWVLTRN